MLELKGFNCYTVVQPVEDVEDVCPALVVMLNTWIRDVISKKMEDSLWKVKITGNMKV